MTQEVLINPQGFINGPSQAFATLDPSAESLSDGIGSSYGVTHYKGKNWTLRYRGETFKFIRADDGTASPYLDIVILQQSRHKSKSYFGKWDPKGGGGRRPTSKE